MASKKKQSETLVNFMNSIIARFENNGQRSTMMHYRSTLNSIMRFSGNKDFMLSEIDSDLVRSYEAYLKNVAGVCRNTSSFYMRIFRAVYNAAVEKGQATQRHPFKHVYTGIDRTQKRAIPTDVISGIKHLGHDLSPKQELARDTFLMCFYLRGISFIDLAHLRKSDIQNGFLYYTRSKTRQRLSIKWEKDMQGIVDKYRHITSSSTYLFPFLVGNAKNDQDETRLYHNAEARITYHLKKIGKKIGFHGKLTLYVARHSWATAARNRHVPISIISQALGHDSEKTTMIYLQSIQSSDVDKANAEIISSL